jgi:hypothetical protein
VSVEELLALVISYTQEQYLRRAAEVRITLDDGRKINLPVPPGLHGAAPAGGIESVEGIPTELAEAVFNRLADTGTRHTRDEMSTALKDDFSESLVHKALWLLRKEGKLSNKKDAYGLGFGLCEWS